MQNSRPALFESLRAAALTGGLAWAAYEIIYHCYFYLVPFLVQPADTVILPRQWTLAGIYIAIYFVIGTIAGPVTWLLLNRALSRAGWDAPGRREEMTLTSGSLSLIVALGFSILTAEDVGRREFFLLAVLAALGAALAAGCKPDSAVRRISVLLDPWILSVILVGGPWIWEKNLVSTPLKKALLPAGIGVASLIFSLLARSLFRKSVSAGALVFFRRQTAAFTVAALAAAGWSLWLGRADPRLPAAAPGRGVGSGKPDVVLIVMDTVRRDELSLYGYERATTPELEKFASFSTVYDRAIATSNMTLPTHGSLFTGLYASRHGAHYLPPYLPIGNPLGSEQVTMAEILRDSGYRTAAVVSNYRYLDEYYGFGQGFELYDDRAHLETSPAQMGAFLHGWVSKMLPARLVTESERWYRNADDINIQAFRVIDDVAGTSEPFFLFLNYMDAHQPYVPAAPFDSLFPGRDLNFNVYGYPAMREEVMSLARSIEPWEKDSLQSQYDGAIAYMDSRIAKVFSKLREVNRFENSLVIVTADHGEAFGEHHELAHGGTLYQTQIAVPLVIKYPRQREGRKMGAIVSQVDVLPTVLAAAGIVAPDGLDGSSLVDAQGPVHDWVMSEAFQSPAYNGLAERFQVAQDAVIAGRKKLILPGADGVEMYDVAADPGEERNIRALEAERANQLASLLRKWQAAAVSARPDGAAPESSEILNRLRSLGYVK